MTDVLFYQLERGWRAVVQTNGSRRWTGRFYRQQPVFLTAGEDDPNCATVRFLADGGDLGSYARIVTPV
jgi:DNA polymerase IIIc chi subunit